VKYMGPGKVKPLGPRLPRHVQSHSFRPGISYGGLASPASSFLPRPGPLLGAPASLDYDPVFALYDHGHRSYDPPEPWFNGSAPTSEPVLMLGQTPTHNAHTITNPEYDDSLMTADLMDAIVGPFESLEAGEIELVDVEPLESPMEATDQHFPGAPDPIDQVRPIETDGYSALEQLVLEAEPGYVADMGGPLPLPLDPFSGQSEFPDPDEMLEELAAQHQLMMNPPIDYGPGMMPPPGPF
jgi:hypothetical protein